MRELLRNAWWVIRVDDDRRLIDRVRTPTRFETVDEVHAAYQAMLAAMATVDRGRYSVLVDLRGGPARNDPAFEDIVTRYQPALYAGIPRHALLVSTAAGKLQVHRF